MINKEWFKDNGYGQIKWKIILEVDLRNWRLGFSYNPLKNAYGVNCPFRKRFISFKRRTGKLYFCCITLEWINLKEIKE